MVVLEGVKYALDFITFSPEGRTVLAPTPAKIQLWHTPWCDGQPTETLTIRGVNTISFTADNRMLMQGNFFHLLLYDPASSQSTKVTADNPEAYLYYAVLSPDGRHIVAGEWELGEKNGALVCRGIEQPNESIWNVPRKTALVGSCVFLTDDRQFISFEFDGTRTALVSRSIETGRKAVTKVRLVGPRYDLQPEISPDCRFLAIRSSQQVIDIFDTKSLTAEPRYIRAGKSKQEIKGFAFHPSGRYLAVANNDVAITLYDTATWQVARTYSWDIGRLRSIAFSPDGLLAAAGSSKGKIIVWDVDL